MSWICRVLGHRYVFKKFSYEVTAVCSRKGCAHSELLWSSKIDRNVALRINYPVGTKVIVKGNVENDPFFIAKVEGYEDWGKSSQEEMLVLRKPRARETFTTGGVVKRWSVELESALSKLTPNEQWNVLTEWAAKL